MQAYFQNLILFFKIKPQYHHPSLKVVFFQYQISSCCAIPKQDDLCLPAYYNVVTPNYTGAGVGRPGLKEHKEEISGWLGSWSTTFKVAATATCQKLHLLQEMFFLLSPFKFLFWMQFITPKKY